MSRAAKSRAMRFLSRGARGSPSRWPWVRPSGITVAAELNARGARDDDANCGSDRDHQAHFRKPVREPEKARVSRGRRARADGGRDDPEQSERAECAPPHRERRALRRCRAQQFAFEGQLAAVDQPSLSHG